MKSQDSWIPPSPTPQTTRHCAHSWAAPHLSLSSVTDLTLSHRRRQAGPGHQRLSHPDLRRSPGLQLPSGQGDGVPRLQERKCDFVFMVPHFREQRVTLVLSGHKVEPSCSLLTYAPTRCSSSQLTAQLTRFSAPTGSLKRGALFKLFYRLRLASSVCCFAAAILASSSFSSQTVYDISIYTSKGGEKNPASL